MLHKLLFNSFVEGVETVETGIFSKRIKEMRAEKLSTNHEKDPVESVERCKPIYNFSTLSTNFNELSVERFAYLNTLTINELRCFPRVPQLPQQKKNNANKIRSQHEFASIG